MVKRLVNCARVYNESPSVGPYVIPLQAATGRVAIHADGIR